MKALYEIENKKLQFFLGVIFSIVIPTIWGMLVVQFVIRDEYCKHTTLFYFICMQRRKNSLIRMKK